MGFAEELVDQVGAAWSVPPMTPTERAAYLRVFEDVDAETAEQIVRGLILSTRPTRPSPREIASAASEQVVRVGGDADREPVAETTAFTRVGYYRGGDPEQPPIGQPGTLVLSDGLTFTVRAPTPVAAITCPEVLSIVDAQVASVRAALAEVANEPGFAAAAREIDRCVSRPDGLDGDELCTAVIARSHGRFRVLLFEWELETNPATLEALSAARAAWMEGCERRLARSHGHGRAQLVGRVFDGVVARRRAGIDYGAMHPIFAEGDYLGGDPLHPGRASAGTLVAHDAGLSYRLKEGAEVLHLRPREIRSVGVRRPDALRQAVRAGRSAEILELLGGHEGELWGALVGGARKSRQSVLLVIAERDARRCTVGFALAEVSGRRLVAQLQVQRSELGMPALPDPGQLVWGEPTGERSALTTDESTPRPGAGGEAAASSAANVQIPDPLDQIERLGALRDRGLITDDEFDAKKRELLDRI